MKELARKEVLPRHTPHRHPLRSREFLDDSMIAEASARHRRLPTWSPPYSRVIALGKLGKALTIMLHRAKTGSSRTQQPTVQHCRTWAAVFTSSMIPPQRMCHCVGP